MYEELDIDAHRAGPPSLFNALTELPRTLLEMGSLLATFPILASLRRGDGHPVLVLPGFLASDDSTLVLRRYLDYMGYRSIPWRLGRNTGDPQVLQGQLVERLLEEYQRHGRKLTIIGQSLGGVFARELARFHPDRVRQVIALGSPFATRHAGVTRHVVRRLFEHSAGLTIEAMRDILAAVDVRRSPPVPVTAIYSKGDGIVNWRVCREQREDATTQNIEVLGSHCGMAFNPSIYYVIANRLAQPEHDWRRFESRLPGLSLSNSASGA